MTLEEMWNRLAAHQPFADRRGYGPEWARMCAERSEAAAREAHAAAEAVVDAAWVAWADALAVDAQWAADAAWVAAAADVDADGAVRWIQRSEEQE